MAGVWVARGVWGGSEEGAMALEMAVAGEEGAGEVAAWGWEAAAWAEEKGAGLAAMAGGAARVAWVMAVRETGGTTEGAGLG